MWTKTFWVDAAERAIKTAAQVAVAFFIVGETSVVSVNWQGIAGVAAAAAVASVLTSIASEPFGKKGTASLAGDDGHV